MQDYFKWSVLQESVSARGFWANRKCKKVSRATLATGEESAHSSLCRLESVQSERSHYTSVFFGWYSFWFSFFPFLLFYLLPKEVVCLFGVATSTTPCKGTWAQKQYNHDKPDFTEFVSLFFCFFLNSCKVDFLCVDISPKWKICPDKQKWQLRWQHSAVVTLSVWNNQIGKGLVV